MVLLTEASLVRIVVKGTERTVKGPGTLKRKKPVSAYWVKKEGVCFVLSDWRRGGGGAGDRGEGAESYDREKAWSSINHSILSGPPHQRAQLAVSLTLTKLSFFSASAPNFNK
jgi:hypothetical protein